MAAAHYWFCKSTVTPHTEPHTSFNNSNKFNCYHSDDGHVRVQMAIITLISKITGRAEEYKNTVVTAKLGQLLNDTT